MGLSRSSLPNSADRSRSEPASPEQSYNLAVYLLGTYPYPLEDSRPSQTWAFDQDAITGHKILSRGAASNLIEVNKLS